MKTIKALTVLFLWNAGFFASQGFCQSLSAKASNLFRFSESYGTHSGQPNYVEGFDYINDNTIDDKDLRALFDALNAPAKNDLDAEVFAIGIPSQILRAATTAVTLTYQNTGKTTWLRDNGYYLAQLTIGGNMISPPTVPLQMDSVPTHALHTFRFVFNVPGGSTYGLVPLRFRMGKSGLLFGETLNLTVEIVAQLSPTATPTPSPTMLVNTAMPSPSPEATFTASPTGIPLVTMTPTVPITVSPTPPPPATFTPSPTLSPSSTPTPIRTATPTQTASPTATRTPTPPPTQTPTPTPQGFFGYFPLHVGDNQRFESVTDTPPNADWFIRQATGTIQVDVGASKVTAWVIGETGPASRGDQIFIAQVGSQLAIVGAWLGTEWVIEAVMPSPYKKAIVTIIPQKVAFRFGQIIPLGDTTPAHGETWSPIVQVSPLRVSAIVPGIQEVPQYYDVAGRLEGPQNGAGPMVAHTFPGPAVHAPAGIFSDTLRAVITINLKLNSMNILGVETNIPAQASAFGSGTFDFAKNVGVAALQLPTRNAIPGEAFEFASGTVNGQVFP